MNSSAKSDLLPILTTNSSVPVHEKLTVATLSATVVIDGHALKQALGNPDGCLTFGDYSYVFVRCVLKYFDTYTHRVGIVFDRCIGKSSIKTSTRSKRVGKRRPVRRVITGPDVPLPQSFLDHDP